ncbi:MAG: hypothetical protein A2036_02410 [Omnitrophica bacterium GWA2_50_21]|nr:MAG: hypothetical protein A2036_02410 [Omnitrophica bacterium GWA2_50_21]
MNAKNIVILVVAVFLIVLAVKLVNRNDSPGNDISRNLDKAGDNIEEGLEDAKRNIEDAVD